MRDHSFLLWISALSLLAGFQLVNTVTVEEEIAANSLPLRFYMLSKQQWSETTKAKVRDILVQEANARCRRGTGACGVDQWKREFMFSQEHFVSTDEKEADYSLQVNIYMMFNPTVPLNHTTQTRYILNKAALEELLISVRLQVHDETGYAITSIGGSEYSPPPNMYANQVLIPISICILILIIMVVVMLLCLKNYMEKSQQRERAGMATRRGKHRKVKPSGEWHQKMNEIPVTGGRQSRNNQQPK